MEVNKEYELLKRKSYTLVQARVYARAKYLELKTS
jgi:hypothetical protein